MESDMIGKNYRCWVRKEKGRGGGFPKGEGRMGGGGVCKVYLLTTYKYLYLHVAYTYKYLYLHEIFNVWVATVYPRYLYAFINPALA